MGNLTVNHANIDDIYFGSRLFQFVADSTRLPIDQVNFLIVQVFALCIAHVFRVILHPSKVSSTTRHWLAMSVGLCMSYFCFGKQVLLPILLVTVCYAILTCLPVSIFHHVTLVIAMIFLSLVHMHRLYSDGAVVAVDISGPLMIMVQKATSLAYSISDGMSKDSEMTPLQKKFVVRSKPSVLEYFSYLLCFQSVLAGPFFMFTDYQDFIEGSQFIRFRAALKEKHTNQESVNNNNQKSVSYHGTSISNGVTNPAPGSSDVCSHVRRCVEIEEPSPVAAAFTKMFISIVCAIGVILVLPKFPIKYITSPAFMSMSFTYKTLYLLVATTLARQLYYTAWYLADSVCNLSGLGFNGFDHRGRAKWDLVSNVDFFGVEFGTSMKTTLDAWNIGTMRWLRFLVYERAPFQKTLITYLLSSLWHGFYPGYYLTFICGAFFTIASRVVRRSVRPRVETFGGSSALRVYDFVTFVTTRVCLSYVVFPFIILHFWSSFYVYLSFRFYFHLLGLLVMFFLPLLLPPIGSPVVGTKLRDHSVTNGVIHNRPDDEEQRPLEAVRQHNGQLNR